MSDEAIYTAHEARELVSRAVRRTAAAADDWADEMPDAVPGPDALRAFAETVRAIDNQLMGRAPADLMANDNERIHPVEGDGP